MGTVAKSAKAWIDTVGFDGIDIDWEYPAVCRTDGDADKYGTYYCDPENDEQNYIELLKRIRQEIGTEKLQTIAVGMSDMHIQTMSKFYSDEETMGSSLDFVNMMTYDFHGPWEGANFGHNAPLYNSKSAPNPGHSVSDSITTVKSYVDQKYWKKLVMGLPTYGRSVTNPPGLVNGDIQAALDAQKICEAGSCDARQGTHEAGSVSYWEQKDVFDIDGSGYVKYWDDTSKCHYLYNAETNVFMSYDSVETIREKVAWSEANGLGGVMFWEMDDDPMINPKTGAWRPDGEALFDTVLEEMPTCSPPARSNKNSVFV